MRKIILFLSLIITVNLCAQNTLPAITVKNSSGRIIISWRNEYAKAITAINIQRSYDSLKNYSTIGSVLSAQNIENGYADQKPPYNKMYYRLFISFEGGEYIFSEIARPVKEILPPIDIVPDIPDTPTTNKPPVKPVKPADSTDQKIITPTGWVASKKIYSGKDNNIIINLPDAGTKKYSVKFFDDKNRFLFEVHKLTEPYLILERMNFGHTGWFHFELYENGRQVDHNKFYVFKDAKPQQTPPDERGKN